MATRLRSLSAEVIEKQENEGRAGMAWRFDIASDPTVDIMLSRDCDSRINQRDVDAVSTWLTSGRPFHIRRDHPWHNTVILGGIRV